MNEWAYLFPSDFPKWTDTGDIVADRDSYTMKCNEWIMKNPERYAVIKQNIADEMQKGRSTQNIEPQVLSNKSGLMGTVLKWRLKEIRVISASHQDKNFFLQRFKELYFQEDNLLKVNENKDFELFVSNEIIFGKLEIQTKGLTLKIKSDNCETCYKDIEMVNVIQTQSTWVWNMVSEFEGDDSVFELAFYLE